ncbi:MAG TPA: hypothetical protein VND93_25425, partial [Myxococcales bacterium]|nr:hypothetical protein [Myxococcales bacterium]
MEGNGHQGSRWERVLEQKPIPLLDHLVEEVARLLATDLLEWPPPIQDLDPISGAQFAPLLEPGAPRPDDRAYHEAFRLTRWELEHDLLAYDDYMKNRRWMEIGLPAESRPALLFLSRWLYEQLSGLAEATGNRVKRHHLQQVL